MKHIYIYIFFFLLLSNLYSQDKVLLSIDDETITVDEFMKTYYKNRLDNDTLIFSESLQEYLDLVRHEYLF